MIIDDNDNDYNVEIHNLIINELKKNSTSCQMLWTQSQPQPQPQPRHSQSQEETPKGITKFLLKDLLDLENSTKGKILKNKLIIDVIRENDFEFLKIWDTVQVKYMNNLKGNFGIINEKIYLSYIFHESDNSNKVFLSNSKIFVEKQLDLFKKLWRVATPLEESEKEIKYQDKDTDFQTPRTVENPKHIQYELSKIIGQSSKELLIYSSIEILDLILKEYHLLNYFIYLIKREKLIIKILTDNSGGTLGTLFTKIDNIVSLEKM